MAVTLLRAFIQNSDSSSACNTKVLIMKDPDLREEDARYRKSVITKLMYWMSPKGLDEIDSTIENAILSLFTQIIKDETDYNLKIGKEFIPQCANERLKLVKKYILKKSGSDEKHTNNS